MGLMFHVEHVVRPVVSFAAMRRRARPVWIGGVRVGVGDGVVGVGATWNCGEIVWRL